MPTPGPRGRPVLTPVGPLAALPAVVLTAELPSAVVLAVPTGPGEDGAVLLGSAPGTEGVLVREQVKGTAGEVVSVPGEAPYDRVLLVGTGTASAADLRAAGAALARKA